MTNRPLTPDVSDVAKMLPLTDGVVDELRPSDGDAYLANAPLANDVFWPVAMDAEAIDDWIRASELACAPSLPLAIRVNGILVAGIEARTLSPTIGEILYWVFPCTAPMRYATRAVALVREALLAACHLTTIQMRVRSGTRPPWSLRIVLASPRSSVRATRSSSTDESASAQNVTGNDSSPQCASLVQAPGQDSVQATSRGPSERSRNVRMWPIPNRVMTSLLSRSGSSSAN
jgi:hypothetical protein